MENEKRNFGHIRICAVGKFLAELKQGQYMDPAHTAAVICTDEPVADKALDRLPNCRLQFIDTEDPGDQRAFTRRQAQTIRDFLASLPKDVTTLYCCCDWGQSRSAGLAAACMAAGGRDPGYVFRNRAYSPNVLVYGYMCEALGCGLPSAEAIDALKRPCMKADSLQRIVLAGDADVLTPRSSAGDADGESRAPAERAGVPVEDRRVSGWMIPWSEEELLADVHSMGTVSPGETILLVCGARDLLEGRDVQACRERLRKYLCWLKYRYQGVHLRLLVPPEGADHGGDPRTKELSAQYTALAAEEQIPVLNPAPSGPLTEERLAACLTGEQ